jgi:hypothetical protein
MTNKSHSEFGFTKLFVLLSLIATVIVLALLFYGGSVRRFARESLMQRVTSSHYEILCPAGALSQTAMTQFATQREPLFASLDKKVGDAASNSEIRVILDPKFPVPPDATGPQPYSVTGTTVRTRLSGDVPQLPAAADAEALLSVAWGKHGNAQIARWTAIWLVGDWHGAEIGMAAAQVEQRLGHKKIESLLANPAGEISSIDDHTLLGAAWISEIAEFGGPGAVRKVYSARMARPNLTQVTQALDTTPLELDRKWQLWMYSYLAGMPAMPRDSGMQMDMPMGR